MAFLGRAPNVKAPGRRRSGVLLPLFACPSRRSWGIGDIGDIAPITTWLADGRQRILLLLPLNEMAPGQRSPYSAISAMAIDPLFISLRAVPEFAALGGEEAMSAEERRLLGAVRCAATIQYRSPNSELTTVFSISA